MKKGIRLATALAMAAALLSATGCNKLRARDQLNKGVQAYKSANYEQAINHFQNAVGLDDDLRVAKLYLATAYAQQYVPGVDTQENRHNAELAIEEYKKVLENEPDSVNSLKGTAYLYMSMRKFDQAREAYKKALQIDPDDPELYYSLGVIAFYQAYRDADEAKKAAQMKVEDVLKSKSDQKICQELRAKDGAVIEEGMKMLETAITKRENYDDAMVYLNLLYRRKANDLSCDDATARVENMKIADQWSDKAMAARKRKAEEAAKKNQGGVIMEPTPPPSSK